MSGPRASLGVIVACAGAFSCSEHQSSVPSGINFVSRGEGAPNAEPLWPLRLGYRHEDWTVLDVADGDAGKLISFVNMRDGNWVRFLGATDGLYVISTAEAGRRPEPFLVVPAEARVGMEWQQHTPIRTIDDRGQPDYIYDLDTPFTFTVASNDLVPTPFGLKRVWNIRVRGPRRPYDPIVTRDIPSVETWLSFIEGRGPAADGFPVTFHWESLRWLTPLGTAASAAPKPPDPMTPFRALVPLSDNISPGSGLRASRLEPLSPEPWFRDRLLSDLSAVRTPDGLVLRATTLASSYSEILSDNLPSQTFTAPGLEVDCFRLDGDALVSLKDSSGMAPEYCRHSSTFELHPERGLVHFETVEGDFGERWLRTTCSPTNCPDIYVDPIAQTTSRSGEVLMLAWHDSLHGFGIVELADPFSHTDLSLVRYPLGDRLFDPVAYAHPAQTRFLSETPDGFAHFGFTHGESHTQAGGHAVELFAGTFDGAQSNELHRGFRAVGPLTSQLDGRARTLMGIDRAGVIFELSLEGPSLGRRNLARVELPEDHRTAGAVRVSGSEALVVTASGLYDWWPFGTTTSEPDSWEVRYRSRYDLPELSVSRVSLEHSADESRSPSILALHTTRTGNSVRLCWPIGQASPTELGDLTLGGRPAVALRDDPQGNCLFIVPEVPVASVFECEGSSETGFKQVCERGTIVKECVLGSPIERYCPEPLVCAPRPSGGLHVQTGTPKAACFPPGHESSCAWAADPNGDCSARLGEPAVCWTADGSCRRAPSNEGSAELLVEGTIPGIGPIASTYVDAVVFQEPAGPDPPPLQSQEPLEVRAPTMAGFVGPASKFGMSSLRTGTLAPKELGTRVIDRAGGGLWQVRTCDPSRPDCVPSLTLENLTEARNIELSTELAAQLTTEVIAPIAAHAGGLLVGELLVSSSGEQRRVPVPSAIPEALSRPVAFVAFADGTVCGQGLDATAQTVTYCVEANGDERRSAPSRTDSGRRFPYSSRDGAIFSEPFVKTSEIIPGGGRRRLLEAVTDGQTLSSDTETLANGAMPFSPAPGDPACTEATESMAFCQNELLIVFCHQGSWLRRDCSTVSPEAVCAAEHPPPSGIEGPQPPARIACHSDIPEPAFAVRRFDSGNMRFEDVLLEGLYSPKESFNRPVLVTQGAYGPDGALFVLLAISDTFLNERGGQIEQTIRRLYEVDRLGFHLLDADLDEILSDPLLFEPQLVVASRTLSLLGRAGAKSVHLVRP
ncbi:MAG: hypothetical protein HYV07_13010 [Deltaproteobacteria bacterium]|nr:hypothetical protein [Deltaproteobacteria bacterium]